jgi:signal transduction histidine kinase
MPYDTTTFPRIGLQSHQGSLRQRIFTPLNFAAYITWIAICIATLDVSKLRAGELHEWAGFAALAAMIGLFALSSSRRLPARSGTALWNILAQGLLVVTAEWLLRGGQTAVLLIIIAAQAVVLMSPRMVMLYILALNAAIAALWVSRGDTVGAALLSMLPLVGFQAFSALTGHFATSSERARAHLAQVNTELLATRRLLEESARAGERLKLSRELHDVAGHSLTALKLNLACLLREPALADREELRVSNALADDLLCQIRQVVGALRAHDGIDLRAALDVLAYPLPGTQVEIAIDDGLRVDDIDQAEALLRCAQEAITNAVRHGHATRISVGLHRTAGGLELRIVNDGMSPATLTPGNGLIGMRERIAAIGGTLDVAPTPPRGVLVVARIPTIADMTSTA